MGCSLGLIQEILYKPERKLSILPFPSVFIKLGQQFFGRYNCFRWPQIQIPVALRLFAFIRWISSLLMSMNMFHQTKIMKLPVTCEMIGEMLLLSPLKGKNLLKDGFWAFGRCFWREAAPKTTTLMGIGNTTRGDSTNSSKMAMI